MKKFAIAVCLLGIMSTSSSAFASFTVEDNAKAPFVKSRGFTMEMAKMVDLVRYNHSSGKADVYFSRDPYADDNTKLGNAYTKVKRWLDPGQDDEIFGRHEIKFTNTWGQMDSYITDQDRKEPLKFEDYYTQENL